MSKAVLDRGDFQELVFSSTEGIPDVSSSKLLLHAMPKINDGISLSKSYELIKSIACQLSQEEGDGYSRLAGRFLCRELRLKAGLGVDGFSLEKYVSEMVDCGHYAAYLLTSFRTQDWEVLQKLLDSDKEELVPIGDLREEFETYCLKTSIKGKKYIETPQLARLLLCVTMFHSEKKRRLRAIEHMFELLESRLVSLPPTIMRTLRTPVPRLTSGTHISVGDSLDSISAASGEVLKLGAASAAISISLGAIRGLGAKIGESKTHGGVVPIAEHFLTATKVCQCDLHEEGVHLTIPFWHSDLLQVLSSSSLSRCRLTIQLSKLVYERIMKDGDVTFVSPDKEGELYESFIADPDRFDSLYTQMEGEGAGLRKIKAADLIGRIVHRASQGLVDVHHADLSSMYSVFSSGAEVPVGEAWVPSRFVSCYRESGLSLSVAYSLLNGEKSGEAMGLVIRAMDNLVELNTVSNGSEVDYLAEYRPVCISVDFSQVDQNELSPARLADVLGKAYLRALECTTKLAEEKGACSASDGLRLRLGTIPSVNFKSNAIGRLFDDVVELDSTSEMVNYEKFGVRNSVVFGQVHSGMEGQEADMVLKTIAQRYLGSPQKVVISARAQGIKANVRALVKCYQLGIRLVSLGMPD